MLLRFTIRNYRSIADRHDLSLVASRLDDNLDNLIDIEGFSHKILPVAVIYGANAAGKSNFLTALKFFTRGIANSHQKKENEKINRQFFLLDECDDSNTSDFEAEFLIKHPDIKNGNEYCRFTYGFSISDDAVEQEWLYAFPNNHRQIWFHRNKSEESEFYFGRELKGQNKVIASFTSPPSLFLSSAFNANHKQLTPIYQYLTGSIIIRLDNLSFDEKSPIVTFLEDEDLREKLLDILKNADTGICGAIVEEDQVQSKNDDLLKAINELITVHNPSLPHLSQDKVKKNKKVRLGHSSNKGTIFFSLQSESRGTLAFLELLGMVLIAVTTGSLLVVDELDSSLHPLLSKKLIGLFNSKISNPLGAQLIFSTHDASLLSKDILRRDQIYFVKKDRSGKSDIYPLTKYKTTKSDNIQKGYLEGRFGGVPSLGDFSSITIED